MICKQCKKEFYSNSHLQKYCSKKCQRKADYIRNKEKIIKRIRRWEYKNKEKKKIYNKKAMQKYVSEGKMNKAMKENYSKNKEKWNSRTKTRKILFGLNGYKKYEIEKICKKCGSKNSLEVHHGIYPTKKEEILKAIKEGKIYFLCKKHHKEVTKQNRKIYKLTNINTNTNKRTLTNKKNEV